MATIDLFAHNRNRLMNRLHTALLALGSLALLAITAWAFGGGMGLLYAVVFGGISLWLMRSVSPKMVLSMYKAMPVGAAEFPAGVAMVEELASRAGLPATPGLYIIPSKMMNAFAVGRRDDSAIAITDALARTLSARELAGVLAHEISHVAHGDVRVMAFADVVSRLTSLMSSVGVISLLWNFSSLLGAGRVGDEPVPWLAVLFLLAAPTIGGLLQMALSRTREFDADLGSAMLTGDPDGLASALTKLEKVQGKIWEGLVLPGSRIPDPSILRSHPRTADRVARLMALKTAPGQAGDTGIAAAPRPRPSMVPRIARHTAPLASDTSFPDGSGIAALVDPAQPIDDALPASDHALNPAKSRPRIRVTRGGVWW